ncbi:MAG TPA: hypothetical protein VFY43_06300, partial [Candidatus Limnocylindria bacterium]|nr:hypothetical protein [Candidatus Limnocylindria bacterium]
MGVFDGVHRGHAAVLEATRLAGEARRLPSVALVFDPHPSEVVRPGSVVRRLAPLHVNVAHIRRELGLTHVIPFRFDDDIRSQAADQFLAFLRTDIIVRALVMT